MDADETPRVVVGDIIRISVALIQQINELPEHRTVRVRLDHIHIDPDGSKVLHLTTVGLGIWDSETGSLH